MDIQTQTFDYSFETKATDDKTGEFEGYASTFGNVDQGGDVVDPGAFIEGIVKAKNEGRNIPMLWQHDRHEPIGVWSEISEDTKGLKVKGRLLIDDDPLARRAYGHLKAKSLGGMSIGYRIPAGGMEEDKNRRGVYRLKKIDLREISLVTMPMNTAAKVTAVKSILEAGGLPSLPDFERFLCEAGFSKTQARAVAGKGLSHLLGQCEAGGGGDESEAFFRALAG